MPRPAPTSHTRPYLHTRSHFRPPTHPRPPPPQPCPHAPVLIPASCRSASVLVPASNPPGPAPPPPASDMTCRRAAAHAKATLRLAGRGAARRAGSKVPCPTPRQPTKLYALDPGLRTGFQAVCVVGAGGRQAEQQLVEMFPAAPVQACLQNNVCFVRVRLNVM